MKNPQPLSFSVLIPAYNSAAYVANAVNSVVAAGACGADYEVVVVDDGSTDDTAKIVGAIAADNPRVKLHTKPNGNWGSVINYARERRLLTKECGIVLDSDDLLHRDCFLNASRRMRGADVLMMAFTMRERRGSLRVAPYLFVSREVKPKHRFTISFVPFSVVFRTDLFYSAAPTLREKVRYQDSLLVHTLLREAKSVRFTLASAGTYNRARPGNTTHAPWDDRRFAEEKLLHGDLAAAGFNEFLSYRPLLFGYPRKAKGENYRIRLTGSPAPLSQPWWARPLYWLIYACKLRRYLTPAPRSGEAADGGA